ncbi:amidohydrolase family protein [Streptomyces sp. NPDC021100]|uniref:amidohydrolase family protein n=1 Tax=Streptomyces sp. NPDC021100 TaxID=3365114 RepID=UPI00379D99B0
MLITADRILAGADGAYLTDGAILVSGDTIVAIGPRAEVEPLAQPGDARLAFPGSTVLPGLIDAHVHLCFDSSVDPVGALHSRDDDALLNDMKGRAKQLLGIGVTTVRDLGDRNHLALRLAGEVEAGSVPGPRIISAGIPVTSPKGHCWFLGGEAAGEEEIRSLVRRNAAAGAKVIKVMETGGGLTKNSTPTWESQFTAQDLAVVVDEARRAGLPVAAHAHGADGIADAVDVGVNTLEHCTWMVPGGGVELRRDVVARIVEKDIAVCPTISPGWRMLTQVPQFAGRAEAMFDGVRQMAQAGVRLIAGTDAGVQRAGFDGLVSSLECYEHLGLSRRRIIAMATSEAARALGIGDRAGELTAGYRADLLVVDGDPLMDLDALRKVAAVFAAGRQYPAAEA